MNFSNKIVMITGANGNLGRAVARAFENRGAQLVLIDQRHSDRGAALGSAPEALVLTADLLDQEQVDRAVEATLQRFGRVDVLCHLAGGFHMGEAVHEISLPRFDFVFNLNVRSVVHIAKAVVPSFLQQGSGKIVNVGAFAASKGIAQMGAYTASKAAVARLTESMSAELRERGVNVNCVLPTTLDTPENRQAMPDVDPARWVALDDLACVILFLASDDARAVHGASLPVSGLS